jgi:hypothetical protein
MVQNGAARENTVKHVNATARSFRSQLCNCQKARPPATLSSMGFIVSLSDYLNLFLGTGVQIRDHACNAHAWLYSDLYQKLFAFQKRDGHTYNASCQSWPTVHDPMPHANALGN